MSSAHGEICLFDNLFQDWKMMFYQKDTGSDNLSWCMSFRLKRTPDVMTVDREITVKKFRKFPNKTLNEVFEFKIYFKKIKAQICNRGYSILAIEYDDGKRIPWDQFTGSEIDAFIPNPEYLPRIYRALSTAHLGSVPRFIKNAMNILFDAMNILFDRHLERITCQRNKKYNAAFYHKVALCIPKRVPNDVVLEIAAYGFKTPFSSLELYCHLLV